MARNNGRGKQVDIEEAIDGAAEATAGHNKVELTDDESRALFFHHKRHIEEALAAKKKADADYKNACKRAKAELGDNAVADIKTAIALEDPSGEVKLKADIDSMLRVARWMGADIGTQFEFFPNREPACDRAFEEGKIAGFKGLAMTPPHDPSVPQYQRWIDGWHAAQEVLLSGFREKLQQAPDVPADFTPPDTSEQPFSS